jgi:hypothetical protein
MSTSSLPPCCAAAVAAEVAKVIERYNASWKANLALIENDWFRRGYDAGWADREAQR